jgi:hypothetical protein
LSPIISGLVRATPKSSNLAFIASSLSSMVKIGWQNYVAGFE